MWLGPLLLAALGLLFGLMPARRRNLIVPATVAVTGATELEHLALWHGLTVPMGLSVLTIGLAVCRLSAAQPLAGHDKSERRAVALTGTFLRMVVGLDVAFGR